MTRSAIRATSSSQTRTFPAWYPLLCSLHVKVSFCLTVAHSILREAALPLHLPPSNCTNMVSSCPFLYRCCFQTTFMPFSSSFLVQHVPMLLVESKCLHDFRYNHPQRLLLLASGSSLVSLSYHFHILPFLTASAEQWIYLPFAFLIEQHKRTSECMNSSVYCALHATLMQSLLHAPLQIQPSPPASHSRISSLQFARSLRLFTC
jgi:hypothetical protein